MVVILDMAYNTNGSVNDVNRIHTTSVHAWHHMRLMALTKKEYAYGQTSEILSDASVT